MRLIYLAFLVLVGSTACDSPKKEPEVEKMKAEDITLGPIVQDSLTSVQLEKIKVIQATFAEVYPASLEETITNFRRDQHPDNEISIWMNMATAYQKFLSGNSSVDSLKKKDAFTLLLLRSMMSEEEATKRAGVKNLSNQEIKDVLRYYNLSPSPVTVRKE